MSSGRRQVLKRTNVFYKCIESDGASHYQLVSGRENVDFWREWWYFNLIDAENDLAAFLVFHTSGNLASPKRENSVRFHFVMFQNSRTQTFDIPVRGLGNKKTNTIELNPSQFGIKIEGDPQVTMQKHISGTYEVFLQSLKHKAMINLVYAPVNSGFTSQLGQFGRSDEWMSWSVPVPYAKVKGTISISERGNREFRVSNAIGYHDHNWGVWRRDKINWDWGQFNVSGKNLSVVFGLVKSERLAGGAVIVDGPSFRGIDQKNLKMSYQNWKKDANGESFPKKLAIKTLDAEDLEIQTTMKNRHFLTNHGKINAIVAHANGCLMGPLSGYSTLDERNNVGFLEHKHLLPLNE